MLASVEPACQTILYQVRSQVNSNSQGSFVSRIQKIPKLELCFLLTFQFRLFECIGDMRKGSPHDYTTKIRCLQQPTRQSRTGEPYERDSLHRIRRTQEDYQ
jgi:hypothetical protein